MPKKPSFGNILANVQCNVLEMFWLIFGAMFAIQYNTTQHLTTQNKYLSFQELTKHNPFIYKNESTPTLNIGEVTL